MNKLWKMRNVFYKRIFHSLFRAVNGFSWDVRNWSVRKEGLSKGWGKFATNIRINSTGISKCRKNTNNCSRSINMQRINSRNHNIYINKPYWNHNEPTNNLSLKTIKYQQNTSKPNKNTSNPNKRMNNLDYDSMSYS